MPNVAFGVPGSHNIRKLLVLQFLPPGYRASPVYDRHFGKYTAILVKTSTRIEGTPRGDIIRRPRTIGDSRHDAHEKCNLDPSSTRTRGRQLGA